jgi:molybdopterin/thiamine biosynthesis adenylyltransferase
MTGFSYEQLVSRNPGFVSAAEQRRLKEAPVFICGVGGMGGACLMSLVRAGMTRFTIADFDRFEVSNLNRQLFATLHTVGVNKVQATVDGVRDLNPEADLRTHGAEWTEKLDEILSTCKVAVNGMDDLRAGLLLYRKAREHGVTVIDAYTSPLPSVTRVRSRDPRPEERLGYPTVGKSWDAVTPEDLDRCKTREITHVMVHSSSHRYFDMAIAGEVMTGRRSRPSFAPMVILTGNLMAFEVIGEVLGRPGGADFRGYFFNPWEGKVERPRNPLTAWLVGLIVRTKLKEMAHAG